MNTNCPKCNQQYEVSEEYMNQQVQCESCGEQFIVSKAPSIAPHQPQEIAINVKQGAIIGAAVCLAIGLILNFITNFLIFIWGPLYLAAFVLSIVAMAQRRIISGLAILLATLILPMIIIGYNIYFGAKVIEKSIKESQKKSIACKTPLSTNKPQASNTTIPIKRTEKEINGAFGYALGQVIDKNNIIKQLKSSDGIKYQVRPISVFKDFKEYYVSVTPTLNKIYEIQASINYKDPSRADKEQKIINALIEKKYGSMEKFSMVSGSMYYIKIDGRIITTTSKSNFTRSSSLILSYVDNSLKKIAEQEGITNASSKIDSSSL